MPLINYEALREAGYIIVSVCGNYVTASRSDRDYLLAWDGAQWLIKG